MVEKTEHRAPAIGLKVFEGSSNWSQIVGFWLLHSSFGRGEITRVEERGNDSPLIYVSFASVGEKCFNLSSIEAGLITHIAVERTSSTREKIAILERVEAGATVEKLYLQISTAVEKVLNNTSRTSFVSPDLNESDFFLICAWENISRLSNIYSFDKLSGRVGEYRALQLCSARQAELVSRSYFEQYGRNVKDISCHQITKASLLWKKADLAVDEVLVDVKNARRSFSSPNNYTEQFIKQFKRDNINGDVVIQGTLSDYISTHNIHSTRISKVLVLGQVKFNEIQDLASWVKRSFSDVFTAYTLTERESYLPGWIFDYDDDFYQALHKAVDMLISSSIENVNKDLVAKCFYDPEIKPFFFLFGYEKLQEWEVDCDVQDFFGLLTAGIRECGLNRRVVFLSVLIYVLLYMRTGKEINFDELLECIFPSSEQDGIRTLYSDRPFGLYDPCKYIYNLTLLLRDMGQQARNELEQIEFFQLRSPSILRGRKKTGRWISVMAYCGGWDSTENVKCGRSPLIIGDSKVCEKCSRLICPSCNFCSISCNR